MSPATMAVRSGSTHWPVNPTTTSGRAKPDSWSHWPNNVSWGTALWALTAASARKGPTTQSPATAWTRS